MIKSISWSSFQCFLVHKSKLPPKLLTLINSSIHNTNSPNSLTYQVFSLIQVFFTPSHPKIYLIAEFCPFWRSLITLQLASPSNDSNNVILIQLVHYLQYNFLLSFPMKSFFLGWEIFPASYSVNCVLRKVFVRIQRSWCLNLYHVW